jgi:hypothetical protein
MAATVGEAARIGKRRGNEALIERLLHTRSPTTRSDQSLELTCECRRVDCSETVRMFESHFHKVIGADRIALIAPGHADDDEQIVATSTNYLLVRPSDIHVSQQAQ